MKCSIVVLLNISTFLCLISRFPASSLLPEYYLRKEIFKTYDPKVFPEPVDSQPLDIQVHVSLLSIDLVDIRSSTARSTFLLSVRWKDHQLRWNMTSNTPIATIFEKSMSIWAPNICLATTYESLTSKKARDVSISSNGSCTMKISESLLGVCKSDVKDFPLDVHNCSFKLSVTNVPLDKGNLQLQLPFKYNGKSYAIHGEWSLQTLEESTQEGNYLAFSINMVIRRNPKYTVKKIVIPMLILMIVSSLGHLLSVASGERIGYSMTAMLTMIIANQYITEDIPETGDDPNIVHFGRIATGCMVLSLFITSVVTNFYYKKFKPMSSRMRRMLHVICRLLCLSGSSNDQKIDVEIEDSSFDSKKDWVLLACALDRISFIFLSTMCILVMMIISTKYFMKS